MTFHNNRSLFTRRVRMFFALVSTSRIVLTSLLYTNPRVSSEQHRFVGAMNNEWRTVREWNYVTFQNHFFQNPSGAIARIYYAIFESDLVFFFWCLHLELYGFFRVFLCNFIWAVPKSKSAQMKTQKKKCLKLISKAYPLLCICMGVVIRCRNWNPIIIGGVEKNYFG